jgi:hypothetical protein
MLNPNVGSVIQGPKGPHTRNSVQHRKEHDHGCEEKSCEEKIRQKSEEEVI